MQARPARCIVGSVEPGMISTTELSRRLKTNRNFLLSLRLREILPAPIAVINKTHYYSLPAIEAFEREYEITGDPSFKGPRLRKRDTAAA